jgi:hypothetical protein
MCCARRSVAFSSQVERRHLDAELPIDGLQHIRDGMLKIWKFGDSEAQQNTSIIN